MGVNELVWSNGLVKLDCIARSYGIVLLEWVNLVVCKFYLNKAVTEKEQ